MIAFGHTAIGAGVGLYTATLTSDLVLGSLTAFGAGIISHYVADFVPHGHFFGINTKNFKSKIFKAIVFDLFLSLVIFVGAAYLKFDLSTTFLFILAGIAGSQLPDVLDGFIYIDVLPNKGLIKKENDFHQLMHWHGAKEKGLRWNLLKRDFWQVGVVLAVLILLT